MDESRSNEEKTDKESEANVESTLDQVGKFILKLINNILVLKLLFSHLITNKVCICF